jgi:hypothetical protein
LARLAAWIDTEVLALGKGLPAVDDDDGAGDVGGLVGGKEERRIGDGERPRQPRGIASSMMG